MVLGYNLWSHSDGTPKSKVLQLGTVSFTMRHEDIDINIVYLFNWILAVRVKLVINSFEKRIVHPIQILLRDEAVPAK